MGGGARKAKIRVIALALIRDEDRLFLSQGCDPATSRRFWRPLGGGIEFGERSAEALRREFREEIGQSIVILSAPTLFENVFTYDGRAGHEIILLHEARFESEAMLSAEPFEFSEPGVDGSTHRVQWVPIEQLQNGSEPLFPTGLLEFVLGH